MIRLDERGGFAYVLTWPCGHERHIEQGGDAAPTICLRCRKGTKRDCVVTTRPLEPGERERTEQMERAAAFRIREQP